MNLISDSFNYTSQDHQEYEDIGYKIFNPFLSKEGLESCRHELDLMINGKLQPGRKPDEIISAHHQESWAWELATHPKVLDMIEMQIGPNIVLWSSHLICKPPGSGMHIPWHQDAPYWNVSGGLAAGIWIAFDDVDASNGGMCILPRWHQRGVLPIAQRQARLFNQEIDPSSLPKDIDQVKVQYRFKAGGMAIHNTMIPHTSEPNRSDRWRRVAVFRYVRADGEHGPKEYEDYQTGKPFDRKFFLVRGEDVANRNLPRTPFINH